MNTQDLPLSLADLSAAGVSIRHVEAATIVHQLALRVSRGELPGVPSAHVIRLSPSGAISVEGPVAAGGRSVTRAAHLLETLLPGFDAAPELRVPGALRLVVARALGTLDLPPYSSLDDFAAALSRFTSPDPVTIVAALVARRTRTVEHAPALPVALRLPVDAADQAPVNGGGSGSTPTAEPAQAADSQPAQATGSAPAQAAASGAAQGTLPDPRQAATSTPSRPGVPVPAQAAGSEPARAAGSAPAHAAGSALVRFESRGSTDRHDPTASHGPARTRELAASGAAQLVHATDASPLTISDIRRARRATGLTLAEISERSHISARLLCELEWGYLRNWPASHVGRRQLVRYARAAGLDDQVVVRTVWPMLEEAERERGAELPEVRAVVPEVEVSQTSIATIPRIGPAPRRWRAKRVVAALAIPALLALGIAPALWHRSTAGVYPAAANGQPTASVARRTDAGVPAATAAPTATSRATTTAAAPIATSTSAAAATSSSAPVTERHARSESKGTGPRNGAAIDAELTDAHPAIGIPDGRSYSPSFDSVGSAMFYQAESDGRSALMRADTDSRGSILRITSIVDDRARNFHARPSPDGSQIAFDSDRDGERAVYIADADGHNVRRVSEDGFAAIPSWSPDGGTIAFVRAEPDRPKVWNLWTTDLSSGRTRRLTSYRYGQPWGGSWFPDGRRIAYSHEERLVILDLASGAERVFPSPVPGHLVRTPAVSPDGKRVMFQVHRDGTWLLELADGSMRKVLSDPSAEEYTWSPDGRRVAYHSRSAGSWGVWVMAPR